MFFRRHQSKPPMPKTPIETALTMLSHAVIIAYGYKHNRRYMPSKYDLDMFQLLADELWQNYQTVLHINECLQRRVRGEPEHGPQWDRGEWLKRIPEE